MLGNKATAHNIHFNLVHLKALRISGVEITSLPPLVMNNPLFCGKSLVIIVTVKLFIFLRDWTAHETVLLFPTCFPELLQHKIADNERICTIYIASNVLFINLFYIFYSKYIDNEISKFAAYMKMLLANCLFVLLNHNT